MRPSEVFEQDGWKPGGVGQVGEARCMLGLIGTAFGCEETSTKQTGHWIEGNSLASSYTSVLVRLIGAPIIDKARDYQIVYYWNDAPERTKEEVIALLREVEAEVYAHPVPWAEKGLAYASISSRAD